MNQENNQNGVSSAVPQSVPEVPSAPVAPVQEYTPVAPVGNNTGIPETPAAPTQPAVQFESVAPVGDNTGIPETPAPPEEVVENSEVPEENNNTTVSNETKSPEGPSVVKPNAYNVEAVVVTEEEQLIYEYIGNNHKKIVHKRFNFAALFFNALYFFYRKMTVFGILLLIVNVVLMNYFPLGILVLCLFCGLFTNKIYVSHVKKKINIIEKRNMDAGLPALLVICEKEGGTSGSLVLVGIILSGVISFVFSKYGTSIDYKKLFYDLMNKGSDVIDKIEDEVEKFNEDSILIPIGDRKYEGTMTYESETDIYDVFSFSFPEEFVDNNVSNMANYKYKDSSFDGCAVDVYQPEGYSTGESLVKQMKKYHAPDKVLKKVTSNNIHWITFDYTNIGNFYVYGTTINGKPYMFEFYTFGEKYKEECMSYKDTIINGVSLQ